MACLSIRLGRPGSIRFPATYTQNGFFSYAQGHTSYDLSVGVRLKTVPMHMHYFYCASLLELPRSWYESDHFRQLQQLRRKP